MIHQLKSLWTRSADTVVFSTSSYRLSLGTLLFALLLLLLGAIAAGLFKRFLRRRFRPLRRLPESSRHLATRWSAFLVFAVFLAFALHALGIPLTAFNFLGGAIALGFGFGAQNICSNVISGIIIILTQPYRRGDVVEVNGQAGTVVSVGLRATEVLTYDGINLVVPNSLFIQNVIANRSTDARALRGSVSVSVAYSPDPAYTQTVAEILRATAAAHPAVLTAPGKAPWVLLDDFADSGIVFKVFFWTDLAKQGVPATASDIRHAIYSALLSRSISIPYPRLDVSLSPSP
jgi:small-conductance mechanosensitive channel